MKLKQFNSFIDAARRAAEQFLKDTADSTATTPVPNRIRIISHHDCDGICSAAVIVAALLRSNRTYSLSVVPQLNAEIINRLSEEPYDIFIFADLGSGQLQAISESMRNKKVYILDHHEVKDNFISGNLVSENIIHLNPHLYGIEGGTEISGSGVAYFFAKSLSPDNAILSHIPIIGAIGDLQEKNGLTGLNQLILEDAVASGRIKITKGLRFFGTQTRPLHKVLEYSFDLFIPGISGSESGAIQFLQDIGIYPKNNNKNNDSSSKNTHNNTEYFSIKLSDLNEKEMQNLVTGLLMRRLSEAAPEDIIGPIYILPHEQPGVTRDAREFATLLNACGRLGKASVGIGALIGDKEMKSRAIQEGMNYKKEIMNALQWVESNENNCITKGNGYMIIDGRNKIRYSIIGTVASILSKSGQLAKGTVIIGFSDADDRTVKVSIRQCGEGGANLMSLLEQIVSDVDGEIGGHFNAAGAQIDADKVDEFVAKAKKVLGKW